MSACRSGLPLAAATMVMLGSGTLHAGTAPLDLAILPNGHVRIDNGPELDIKQLKARIAEFKRQHPQPDLAPHPDKATQFGAVRVIIQTFQDANYGDHLTYAGADQGK